MISTARAAYRIGDKPHFEATIKPYTCFVGIYIKLK